MILARPVNRPDGPVLVGEGQVLTNAAIRRIRDAGIGTVWVEGTPLGPEGDVGNLRVIAESLPDLFRRHTDNVFMITMCNVLLRHFEQRIAEQQALEDARIEAARLAEAEKAKRGGNRSGGKSG